MVIAWNTGLAAERARHNLRLKKKKRKKRQAASSKHPGPRKIKYGGRPNNPHATCKRRPRLGLEAPS